MQKFKNDRKNVDKILEAMVTGGISVWRGGGCGQFLDLMSKDVRRKK